MLEAAGLPVPPAMQGESLLPLMRDAARRPTDRPVYAETEYPRRRSGGARWSSWRTDRFLFVRAPQPRAVRPGRRSGRGEEPRRRRGARRRRAGRRARAVPPAAAASAGRRRAARRAIDPAVAERLGLARLRRRIGGAPNAHRRRSEGSDRASRTRCTTAIVAVEDGAFRARDSAAREGDRQRAGRFRSRSSISASRARASGSTRGDRAAAEGRSSLDPDRLLAPLRARHRVLRNRRSARARAEHFEVSSSRMPKWADARYSLGRSTRGSIESPTRSPNCVRRSRSSRVTSARTCSSAAS